mgnify:CR=1 FL=1
MYHIPRHNIPLQSHKAEQSSAFNLSASEFSANVCKFFKNFVDCFVAFLNSKGAVCCTKSHGVSNALFAFGNGRTFINVEKFNLFKKFACACADCFFKSCCGKFVVADDCKVTGGSRELGRGAEFLFNNSCIEDICDIESCNISAGLDSVVIENCGSNFADYADFLFADGDICASSAVEGGVLFVCGEFNAEYYTTYLKEKFTKLYNL